MLTLPEQESEVVLRQLAQRLAVPPDRTLEHRLFLLLELQDTLLNRTGDYETRGTDRLVLQNENHAKSQRCTKASIFTFIRFRHGR